MHCNAEDTTKVLLKAFKLRDTSKEISGDIFSFQAT